jgi:hypothetical protein
MQFTVGAWNKAWRTWCYLNASELTWIALLTGLILFTDLFVRR